MSDNQTTADAVWDPDANPDDNYKWKAFSAIGIALVTMVMSFSIVFLALSSISDDFGVTLRAVSWVVIAQSLTISAVMLPLGRVADMVGRKKFHLTGIALFGGGAIFAALSPTLPILILARVVMAVGNSMGQSVGTAIIISVFPTAERGKGLGAQTTAVAVGSAAGPIVAGLLLQFLSWRYLFVFMSIPIAIAFVWGYFILDDKRIGSARSDADRPPYDWPGAALSATGMIVLVLTINNPLAVGWLSPLIIGGSVLTVGIFVWFVKWELRTPAPMLDLRLFKITVFKYAVAARYLGFMSVSATFFMMPIFLLSFRGMSEGATGAVLSVGALGLGVSAQASGRLSDRFGHRWLTVLGMVILLATSVSFSFFTRTTPVWLIMLVLFANGAGIGMWNVPNNSATMGAVPRSAYGVVSAFVNLVRNVGSVVGQAVIAAVVVGVMVSRGFDIPLSEIESTLGAADAFIDGWRIAYIVVTAVGVLATIAAVLTRPSDSPIGIPADSK
ncbi:MAG: MFS transporter [Chloroflexi bacterium]|nr:MFS transporter [Chloroflexota bacterium]